MTEKKDELSFNRRLMNAMAEMVNPTKSKTAKVPTKSGKEYSYNYESLDQVLAVVRPALVNNGLMLVQGIRWHEPSNGYVLETGAMSEDETRILDTRPMHSANDAQAEGSWETYMRRYALRTAFGLTGEDDDGAATKVAKNQNTTSKRNTDVMQGAKVTEMASDALMGKIEEKILELANLKGKSGAEVKEALMQNKNLKGVPFTAMTKAEANTALSLLVKWIGQAQPVEDYADEDIDF